MAAISGHGISVGDLMLSLTAVRDGLLTLPFTQAVATGDGYYFVWPRACAKTSQTEALHCWLKEHVPHELPEAVQRLNIGD